MNTDNDIGSNYKATAIALLCISPFSILGTLFIIILYYAYPHIRNFALTLVVHLNISCLLFNLGLVLNALTFSQSLYKNEGFCIF